MAEAQSSTHLLERLRNEQRQRWEGGERVLAENLLQEHATLQANADSALELVYNEVLLREKAGETPRLEEYVERFPQFAPGLKRLFEVHQVLESDHGLDRTPPEGTPGTSSADLPAIPGYEVLREVGRGGMGIVYEARQIGLNRTVAIKMILAGDYASPQELARFQTEAQAVGRLQHANIVQIYDVGQLKGRPYLSMEYVAGGSLAQKLRGTPLAVRSSAQLVETLARAIRHAHERGILHRDLTPANVLLTEEGVPKIVDFGLAKLLGAGQVIHTQTGAVVGTPSYMAPEQAWGKTKEVGISVDVYALGAILYELLTGRPPFRAETPLETLLQVQSADPVSPSRLQPKLPRDLATICLQCLHKEPRRRYSDAGALANDLRSFLEGKTIQARPTGVWVRTMKWARRRPAVAALLMLVLFVTVLGFGLVTWQWQRAEAAGQVAADKAKELEIKNYFENIALAELALAAGDVGRAEELLDLCPEGLRGWEWHYLKRLRYGESSSLVHPGAERLACSGDGRYIASGSRDGSIKIWNALAGNELHTIEDAHRGLVGSVVFSPDGQRLASSDVDGLIKIWDTQTRLLLYKLEGHNLPVWRMAFSLNGTRLASGSRDQTVRLWDVTTGREIHAFREHRAAMSGIEYSPDGQQLITVAKDGAVKVLDATTCQEAFSFHAPIRWVHNASLSHDGRRLALASFDGTIKICDAATGQEALALEGHTDMVQGSAWSPDGQRLASSGADGTVRVWDTTSGLEALTLRGHIGLVSGLAFSPDGQRLFSCGKEGRIKIWNATPLSDGQQDRPGIATLRGHGHRVLAVAFSPDGRQLVSGGWDGTVKVWDAATGSELLSLPGHRGVVTGVAFSPGGQRFASGSWDETLKLWDATTGRELATLSEPAGFVHGLAFRPDGRQLAAAHHKGTLTLCNPTTGAKLLTLPGHRDSVLAVAFSPDNLYLASAAHDGTMKIWDVTTGKEMQALLVHAGRILGLAFSPDGKYLASASEDRTIKLWDTRTWDELHTFQGHTNAVAGVVFSPDSQRLASGSWDQTVRIWDVTLDQEPVVLRGHAGYVWGVAFSPDGRRLASCSGYKGKGEIKLWDRSLWENQASGGR